jgi:hypothetical protein
MEFWERIYADPLVQAEEEYVIWMGQRPGSYMSLFEEVDREVPPPIGGDSPSYATGAGQGYIRADHAFMAPSEICSERWSTGVLRIPVQVTPHPQEYWKCLTPSRRSSTCFGV